MPDRGPTLPALRSRVVTLLALLLLPIAAGCGEFQMNVQKMRNAVAGPPAPREGSIALQPLAPVRRDIFTRSYRLGETYSAKTGDTVVGIKNYSVTEKVGRATALRDFGQTCRRPLRGRSAPALCESTPLDAVRGAMGSVYDVIGAATLPDGQFFVVQMPPNGSAQVCLLVDPTGRLRKGAYVAWREAMSAGYTLGQVPVVQMEPEFPLEGSAPLFSFESVEKFVYMGPGYLSFDLVFTGTRDTVRGELMTFSFREYGRDSGDRPAFERQLQFPVSEHVIEVEKLRIEVEPVGYNELRFRVIHDGQPAPTSR